MSLMVTYRLTTPLSEAQVRKLRVNDLVFLSGTLVTARDLAHRRALELFRKGKKLPIDIKDLAIFHCGPVVKKEDDGWVVVAAGPTTSTRMESVEAEFVQGSKVRMIIGKGGMGKRTGAMLADFGGVYCAFTGGAAVLAARAVKRVVGVEWLDLGMAEALWVLEVEKFGPLVVAIDSRGDNLFLDAAKKVKLNKQRIVRKLGF